MNKIKPSYGAKLDSKSQVKSIISIRRKKPNPDDPDGIWDIAKEMGKLMRLNKEGIIKKSVYDELMADYKVQIKSIMSK